VPSAGIRRISTKFAEIRRKSVDPHVVPCHSVKIRRKFGEHSPNIRRISTGKDATRRHSPNFAEIRRNSPNAPDWPARFAKFAESCEFAVQGNSHSPKFAGIHRNSLNLLPSPRRRLRRFSEFAECSPNIRRTFGEIRRMTVGFRSLGQEIRSGDRILRLRSSLGWHSAGIRRNSPKSAECSPNIRRIFAEFRCVTIRIRRNSPKFAELLSPPPRCAEEPRRDSPKFAEIRRNSPDAGEVQSDSPNIRRIFAGHPPNIRRMPPTTGGTERRFAEIRRNSPNL